MKENKKLDFQSFWNKLWNLINFKKSNIVSMVVLFFVIEIVRISSPFFLKVIIDKITNFDPEEIKTIILMIILMLVVNQFDSFLVYIGDNGVLRLIIDVTTKLTKDAQAKMLDLSLSYHEKENTGGKIIKIERGIDKIEGLMGNLFWGFLPTIFQITITSIVLFVVDWRFGLIFTVFAPLLIYLTLIANKKATPYRKKRYDGYEEVSGKLTQSIININTVKSFVQEKREKADYSQSVHKINEGCRTEFKIIFGFNWLRGLVMDIGLVMILLLAVYFAWKSVITIGSLVFVVTISNKALISFYGISKIYDRVMESSEAIERLHGLMQEEADIKNPENGIIVEDLKGEIIFENLNFSYTDANGNTLDKINLTIDSGSVVALIGPSGGGKTTIARMIYRHYDPQIGKIMIDNVDLRKYDLFSIRKNISIVPQEVEIFNLSIKDNISYGRPKASFGEIQKAAQIANAEEFIDNLSEKYDTIVGERGIKLSGGQRQRVGIARAILADPKILIFDEATSSLDSYSERLIQDAMDKISKGRTTIIIAHRLSTIKKANKIVVLEDGKVVEEGSHEELASAKGGLYAKLLKLQEMGDVD